MFERIQQVSAAENQSDCFLTIKHLVLYEVLLFCILTCGKGSIT